MNAHKKLLAPAKGGMQMTRYLHRLFGAFVFVVAMVFLLGTPGAWAETYSSFASHYPSKFDNDCFDSAHNDMQYMDAVYFGGREIIFFTLFTTKNDISDVHDYTRYLFFYSNDPSYSGSLDIGNDPTLDFRIKLVAMDDVLYIFYTAAAPENGYDTGTIYYRTAKVDHGEDGKDWKLDFSEMKSFNASPSPVKIQTAQVMNGIIYVIYSSTNNWFSMSSSDGQNFLGPPIFFSASNIQGFGAAVFQVPDATEGSVDKMMIAYTDGSSVHYSFFDGQNVYSPGTFIETSGLKPASVRLIAGSAQGYSNSKYSIQVFITHDQDETWHSMYHREYTPAGVNGNEGSWSSAWNKLASSDDDAVHCQPNHASDSGWAVIPLFASEAAKAGTFTLTFKGATTTSLAYNASATDVQNALNSLSTIGGLKDPGPGSVTVSLSGNVYTVTFGGSLANTDVDQMLGNGSGGAYALVATTTPGGAVSEVQTVTVSGANVRMYVRLWYARGTHWEYSDCKDQVNFRCSSYQSDLLYYQGRTQVPAGEQDLNTSTVLGVIEGTPPYPTNGKDEWVESEQNSTVELEATVGYKTSTAWTVGSSVAVSFGRKFEKKGGWKAKLSFGLEYTRGSTTSATVTRSDSFQNFTHDPPGDMGWVLVLKPEMINDQYVLRAWDGSGLSYGTDTAVDQVMASVINYGPGTELTYYSYYLQDPSAWIGGSNPYPDIFKGMKARPLSTDVVGWEDAVNTVDPSYKVGPPLPGVGGGIGGKSHITIVETTTDTTSITPSASFSGSVKSLGFNTSAGFEGTVDYSMDFETKTSMEYSLGWYYNLPECAPGISCCIAHMDVDPFLLVPNDNASGYNAPWISDDIRTYQKPKPWCLSYKSYPDDCGFSGSSVTLWVDKAQGTLFLDESGPNRDRASAELTLKGLARDFSLRSLIGEQLVHMRLGNYIINSETNYVLTRGFQGKDLLLRLKESEDSDSFITVRLSYNKAKSKLDINLDADRIDLTGLYAYPLFDTGSSGGEAKTIPFRLFLGGKYYAEGDLGVRCAVNKQKAICHLHSK